MDEDDWIVVDNSSNDHAKIDNIKPLNYAISSSADVRQIKESTASSNATKNEQRIEKEMESKNVIASVNVPKPSTVERSVTDGSTASIIHYHEEAEMDEISDEDEMIDVYVEQVRKHYRGASYPDKAKGSKQHLIEKDSTSQEKEATIEKIVKKENVEVDKDIIHDKAATTTSHTSETSKNLLNETATAYATSSSQANKNDHSVTFAEKEIEQETKKSNMDEKVLESKPVLNFKKIKLQVIAPTPQRNKVLIPGEVFTQTWIVKNVSNFVIPKGLIVSSIDDNLYQAADFRHDKPVNSDESVEITLRFIAPKTDKPPASAYFMIFTLDDSGVKVTLARIKASF